MADPVMADEDELELSPEDLAEFQRIAEGVLAIDAARDALDRDFDALVGRLMAGTAGERRTAQHVIRRWLQEDLDERAEADQEHERIASLLVTDV